ncbi:MAG: 23S rRNA (adenine(2030)-N(6))-methyltransferase RlmJ [Sodalis sp. (in: enterobacteria)]
MLSYRHRFHAGNHADVLKHIVLTLIFITMKKKDKPFLFLDSHAGAGRYLLSDHQTERTGEFLEGIARIWQRVDAPNLLMPYLDVVRYFNPDKYLRYYPGSPLLARQLLRDNDQLYLSELHVNDYSLLRREFHKDHRALVRRANGYQQLKSQLPSISRRGVVLIDPPYEIKTDYQDVVRAIQEGYKRFSNGIYALWYPVVLRQKTKQIFSGLNRSGIRHILQIELAIRPDSNRLGMSGSGMIIVNPPWKLKEEMNLLLPWLHQTLVPSGQGHFFVRWLVPE